jgi:hypothetical protein
MMNVWIYAENCRRNRATFNRCRTWRRQFKMDEKAYRCGLCQRKFTGLAAPLKTRRRYYRPTGAGCATRINGPILNAGAQNGDFNKRSPRA